MAYVRAGSAVKSPASIVCRWRCGIRVSPATCASVSPRASRAARSFSPTVAGTANSSAIPAPANSAGSIVRTRRYPHKKGRARQVRARNHSLTLFDFDFALFGPFLQGGAHVRRWRHEPGVHRLAELLGVDLADQLLDRADRGRSYRQARDAEAEQRQCLEPAPAHLAAHAELHRMPDRGADHALE